MPHITAHKVQHFVWRNIVCRFSAPRRLISDNGTEFPSQQLRNLCAEVGIKQVFASVEHPQTNGQVESANRVLLKGLKRRLEKAKGAWAEEVPRIVWAYHTTPQSSTTRRCCSRPLLRSGRWAPRIKGRIALVFETPRGRYDPVRQASPWAWASKRDLSRAYRVAQRSERNG